MTSGHLAIAFLYTARWLSSILCTFRKTPVPCWLISASPQQLFEQAAWLKENYRILSGEELAEHAAGRLELTEPAVAITFDDAYEDNHSAGRILMEKYRIPAVFFVPTAFIDTGILPAWDRFGYALRHTSKKEFRVEAIGRAAQMVIRPSEYDRSIGQLMEAWRSMNSDQQATLVQAVDDAASVSALDAEVRSPFMSWRQIRDLAAMGHTIGGHTHTHPNLAALGREEQQSEITESKRKIEREVGSKVRLFAYPYGKPGRTFTDETKQCVREAGYAGAFSFYGGWNARRPVDPFDLKRLKVDTHTSLPIFRTRVVSRGQIPV